MVGPSPPSLVLSRLCKGGGPTLSLCSQQWAGPVENELPEGEGGEQLGLVRVRVHLVRGRSELTGQTPGSGNSPPECCRGGELEEEEKRV